jgi:putative hydrolase of the HAD superfamily
MTGPDKLGLKCIFFDLDGTLSDYFGGVEHALEAVWSEFGDSLSPLSKEDFLASYWSEFRQMERLARRGEMTTVEASSRRGRFERVLRRFGSDPDSGLIDRMSDRYTQARLRGARLFPGVREALAALRDVYTLGVVTEGDGRIQREQIRRLGLEESLHHVVISQEAGLHKPDPALYQYALSAAEADPRQSVMVGDRVDWDLIPAKIIGMRTVLFRGNNQYLLLKDEMEFEPDWEISEFVELLELFLPSE